MILQKVLTQLGATLVDSEWKAPCPLCQPEEEDSSKYKLVVNPGNKRLIVCRCFKCCPPDHSYNKDWWIEVCRLVQFPTELYKDWDEDSINKEWATVGNRTVHQQTSTANIDVLDYIYTKLLSYLDLNVKHLTWLEERGLQAEWAWNAGYRSSPSDADSIAYLIGQQFPSLITTVPGFYEGRLLTRDNAIIIPCRNSKGQIFALKQRLLDGRKARIRVLSSSKLGGPKSVNGYHCPMGVGQQRWVRLWLTEGERKADVWWSRKGEPTLAIPGVNQYNTVVEVLPTLVETGGTVVLAMDRDGAGESATKALTPLVQRLGFNTEEAVWTGAKGLDDTITTGREVELKPIPRVEEKLLYPFSQHQTTKPIATGFIRNEQLLGWLKGRGLVLRDSIKCSQYYLTQLIKEKKVAMTHTEEGQVVEVV